MLKKYVLAAVMLLAATNGWAVKSWDVAATPHNLSSVSTAIDYYISTNEDEVCIFCHTPHGGTLNAPLWNRVLPGAVGFTHYYSATLSTAELRTSARAVNPESLLCMSCHDGSVATGNMTTLVNNSNSTGAAPILDGNPTGTLISLVSFERGIGTVIGDVPDAANNPSGQSRNLTDDHPVSFSYFDVSDNLPANAAKLHLVAAAEGAGVRFFPLGGANAAGGKRVECSSCHDPHVNYVSGDTTYNPFLQMPNTGSALCLACHKK